MRAEAPGGGGGGRSIAVRSDVCSRVRVMSSHLRSLAAASTDRESAAVYFPPALPDLFSVYVYAPGTCKQKTAAFPSANFAVESSRAYHNINSLLCTVGVLKLRTY